MMDIVKRLNMCIGWLERDDLTTSAGYMREALAEIERNRAAIAELLAPLVYFMSDFSCTEPSLSVMCRMCDELITKHYPTIKDK